MRINKYVAASMPEALKLVKADLGPKAVILNTRSVKKSGGLGILTKGQIEVTAAIDEPVQAKAEPKPAARKKPPSRPNTETPAADRAARPARRPERDPAAEVTTAPPPRVAREAAPADGSVWADRLSRQIQDLKSALQGADRTTTQGGGRLLPGALKALATQMDEAGLHTELAEEVLADILLDPGEAGLKSLAPLQARASALLAAHMRPGAPTHVSGKMRSVVALVGPAGSGKTTAAARIAAQVTSSGDKRAAFIAADTDRVGGLELLRAYAGILSLPVHVAQSWSWPSVSVATSTSC